MEIALLVISVLLITVVLLQSGKAESASNIDGCKCWTFCPKKERGQNYF